MIDSREYVLIDQFGKPVFRRFLFKEEEAEMNLMVSILRNAGLRISVPDITILGTRDAIVEILIYIYPTPERLSLNNKALYDRYCGILSKFDFEYLYPLERGNYLRILDGVCGSAGSGHPKVWIRIMWDR